LNGGGGALPAESDLGNPKTTMYENIEKHTSSYGTAGFDRGKKKGPSGAKMLRWDTPGTYGKIYGKKDSFVNVSGQIHPSWGVN